MSECVSVCVFVEGREGRGGGVREEKSWIRLLDRLVEATFSHTGGDGLLKSEGEA